MSSSDSLGKMISQQMAAGQRVAPAQLVEELYQAIFPVLLANLKQQRSYDSTVEGGLSLIYQTHTAVTELLREGFKHIERATDKVKNPS
jgi:prolipoprotein diacylglyceryltransferase